MHIASLVLHYVGTTATIDAMALQLVDVITGAFCVVRCFGEFHLVEWCSSRQLVAAQCARTPRQMQLEMEISKDKIRGVSPSLFEVFWSGRTPGPSKPRLNAAHSPIRNQQLEPPRYHEGPRRCNAG